MIRHVESFVIVDRFRTSCSVVFTRYHGTTGQREETRSNDREKEKERDGAEGGKVYLLRHGIGGDVETALSSAETTGPKDVAGLRFPLSFLVSSFFCSLSSSLPRASYAFRGINEAFFNSR